MNENISISDFLKTKEITVNEIKQNFKLVAEYDIDMIKIGIICPHCKSKNNLYNWKSEPWTGVKQCIACQSIILILYQDRMAGVYTDKVMIYKQK